MKIEEYIAHLKKTRDDIPAKVKEFVEKESKYMVGNVKLRFFNYGVDGSGDLIGKGRGYSPKTVERKKKQGQRTSHITLKDTGNWWASLFATYHNGELILESRDKKLTSILVDGEGTWFKGYGPDIMEFTQQEKEQYEDQVLKKLEAYLKEQINKNIEA